MAKPTKEQKEASKAVVKPLLKFANDSKEHAMEVALGSDNPPVIKSVGMFRIPNTNNYVSFNMETQGNKVLSIVVEEPNMRGIAEESAKLSFVEAFMSGSVDNE